MPEAVTRKSVPLSPDDLTVLADIRNPDSTLHDALKAILDEAGLPEPGSESQALHALLVLGRRCVEERAQLSGYAAYAASLDEEDHAVERALRQRRRVATDVD